jgi:hypothetical protein
MEMNVQNRFLMMMTAMYRKYRMMMMTAMYRKYRMTILQIALLVVSRGKRMVVVVQVKQVGLVLNQVQVGVLPHFRMETCPAIG